MSLIEINMFPASYGDSFLVTCRGENNAQNINILIDMGFISTYKNVIKNKLEEIGCGGETIALLVFTHIDEDHIAGGLKFLSENGNIESPNIIKVQNIWFNSYRHIQFLKNGVENSKRDTKMDLFLQSIINKSRPKEQGKRDVQGIGAMQGSTLASLMYFHEYMDVWNSHFDNNAVMVEEVSENGVNKLRKININDEVNITVLSPDDEKLNGLENVWKKELATAGYSEKIASTELMDDAFEIFMTNINSKTPKLRKLYKVSSEEVDDVVMKSLSNPFQPDQTEVNGSSIAFILEFKGKKVLYLADSHPDIIVKNLKIIASANHTDRLWFDAVKISHHGSKHNTCTELLEIIDTDKFIFSTNGRGKGFTHPDIETVYKVIATPNSKKKTLIFNYLPLHIISLINKEELKDRFNYEIQFTNDLSKGIDGLITMIPIK